MRITGRTAARREFIQALWRTAVLALLPLTLSLLTPPDTFAQTLFGPKSYTLTTTSPQTFTALVSTTSGPAHLHVSNGAPDGTARLRDAKITLNGLEVVSSQDVGLDVALVDTPVFLLSSNILTITLSGPTNGTLTLTLERRAAALTSVTPNSGRQAETLTVSVVGSNTHFVQGTTQLFAGPGVSVGGAPPGALGPVTVQDLTHLTATLTISPTTILGPRTLLAKTNGEKAALFHGFTVLAGTPAIAGTTVSTLAGTGTPGLTDGSGTTAQFRLPFDVAPRPDGSAVVADTGNSKLRAIAPDGTTSTVALPVTLLLPTGVTIDASGRTIIADTARCVIRIVNSDGTVTTIGSGTCGFADGPAGTARFKFPRDVVSDAAGNLYVADTGNFRVRKIAPDGTVSTLAGSGLFGSTNGPATTASFGLLAGIAVANGTVIVSDAVHHTLRQIDSSGNVTTLAGSGTAGFADGAASSAQFAFPTAVARDTAGNLYIADTLNNLIRRLTPGGRVETIAGTGARGSLDGPGSEATFNLPFGVGLAAAAPSKLLVADTFNHKIRAIQVVSPPTITALAPTSAVQGDTFTLTVTGTNLTGATAVSFLFLLNGTPDPAITASNLQVNADGTQLTATVNISVTAALGTKVVTVTTAGGTSSSTASSANTFIVLGRLSLIPTFQTLTQGGSGGLTVEITTPAPAGGLAVTLTSDRPTVATVPSPVTIPAGATRVLTSVSAVGEGNSTLSASATGYATATAAVTVILPPPTITGFTPSSGPVGTAVTITGGPFSTVNPLTNTASFTGPNNTRLSSPVTGVAATQLTTTVPSSAVTGPLQVSTPYGSATSTGHFVVLPSPDFALTAVPSAATALQGGQARYALSVTGSDGFTVLVSLSASGLPSGVTAAFTPATLAPGQSGTLTLTVGSGAAAGLSTLTLTGTATIDGAPRTRTTALTLEVLLGGRTALLGQVLVVDGTPLPGVRLTLAGLTTLTDAAGSFLLLDVPSGTQTLSIDANVARPGFPIYGVDLTLTAGQTTVLPPFRITPPPPPERFTPINNATADQVVTDPRFPGVAITLPAGVTITGWDGTPKTKIAIERLTPDRLPMPPPPIPTVSLYQFNFGTPMGGIPSAPLPVTLPNDAGLEPGEKTEIWYYDAAPLPGVPAAWRLAGLGTVSADGTRVVSDPGVGIARFCGVCGTTCILNKRQDNNNPGSPTGGEPVNLAIGQFTIPAKTDLLLPGRLPVTVSRSFNPIDPFGRTAGFELTLGPGWTLSFDAVLLEGSASLRRLILPGNSRFDFVRQPNGTFANTTHPLFAGAVLTQTTSTHTLRFTDGATWRFATGFLARGGFALPGLWLLVEQTDRVGNRLTITRDSFGFPRTLTTPDGRQLTATVDSVAGRLTEVTDPLGRSVRYGYDTAGRLVSVTDPAGGITRYTYDTGGRLLTITDPRTIVFLRNEYSAGSGRILRQTQADGGVWLFRYQLQGATVTGPGCPGVSCPTEESTEKVTAGYTFTGGTITATTLVDPRGNQTVYRFTPTGFALETGDALGQRTAFERDARGQVTASTDALGRVTRFTYDAQGNVTSITDPAGNTTTFTYDSTFNGVISVTDPLGNVTRFEYDTLGNLTAMVDPLGNRSAVVYNTFGQPVSTTDPLGNVTQFEYNAQGDLTATIDPLGNRTIQDYDVVSRLIAQTDSRGKVTRFEYDNINRLTRITDPLNGVTQLRYDPKGNLLTVTDARGGVTTHTYDTMNHLINRTDPLGRVESYQYDSIGNLIQFTDRKGQVSTFTYDALNRRVRSTFADGSFTELTYDAAGRPVTATDSLTGTIIQEYDVRGRLLRETTPQGSIQYAYDASGRRTTMTVNGQAPVSYSYDAASRLTQIVQAPLSPVTFQYDAASGRTSLTLSNQVNTTYQYDGASRIRALLYRNALGPLGDLQYTLDAASNRTAVGGSLARAPLPDAISSASYNAADEQESFGARSMAYDQNGNVTSITDASGTRSFTWDARNRLVGASGPAGTASYRYDVFARRIEKNVNGVITRYLYDDEDIIGELDSANIARAIYLHGPGTDEPLVRTDLLSGQASFYHADGLGSVIQLSDNTGQVVQGYTYDPFGKLFASSSPVSQPYTYTGREFDPETGLYYYRARLYDPTTGRFLQEDPIGTRVYETNLYTYALNDPINLVDPYGLKAECRIIRRSGWEAVGPPKVYEQERWIYVIPPSLPWDIIPLPDPPDEKPRRKWPRINCGLAKIFYFEVTEQLWRYRRYFREVCYDCTGRKTLDTGWIPDGYLEEERRKEERQKRKVDLQFRCGNSP